MDDGKRKQEMVIMIIFFMICLYAGFFIAGLFIVLSVIIAVIKGGKQ